MPTPLSRPFPVPERPLTPLGILDGAFAIMRTRPTTVAGIVAVFVLPTQLLASWLQREAFSSLSFDNFDWETGTFGGSEQPDFGLFAGGPIVVALPYLTLPFIGVALTHLVLGWREGIDRSLGECLRFTVTRTHLIAAAFVLSKLLQFGSLMLLTPATMLVAPVLAAEGTRPVDSCRRAWNLARRRFGQLIGLLLLLALVTVLLNSALSTLPVIGAILLGDWGWVAFFALSLVSTSVLNVLGVGTSVLVYLDLRNRLEGHDLQRRMAALRKVGDR